MINKPTDIELRLADALYQARSILEMYAGSDMHSLNTLASVDRALAEYEYERSKPVDSDSDS